MVVGFDVVFVNLMYVVVVLWYEVGCFVLKVVVKGSGVIVECICDEVVCVGVLMVCEIIFVCVLYVVCELG